MVQAVMPDPSLERCSTCFFPTEFHEVPLVAVKQYNYDTKIFTFGLPEGRLVHRDDCVRASPHAWAVRR